MIRKRRNLFANPEVGKVGQSNEAPEDIDVEEGPREKGWLALSSHKKKEKKVKEEVLDCRSSIHFKRNAFKIWYY